jgi:hypothetical protein
VKKELLQQEEKCPKWYVASHTRHDGRGRHWQTMEMC